MVKLMTDDHDILTPSQVLKTCHLRLEEIKVFLINYEHKLVDLELQKEVSIVVILLQKIEKLVVRASVRKNWKKQRRLQELHVLTDFFKLAVESLFQKVPNLELAKHLRLDIERIVCRYEHPVLGIVLNRFSDIYRSNSIPMALINIKLL